MERAQTPVDPAAGRRSCCSSALGATAVALCRDPLRQIVAQRPLRAAARDPLRRPAGARRRALDARRHDRRLPAARARRDRAGRASTEARGERRRHVRGIARAPRRSRALGALLVWGFSGLPPFGDFHGFYGQLLNRDRACPQRHTTNVVTAIVFDYRGFDTMGEEFILFAAVVGVVLLLREDTRPTPRRAGDRPVRSDAIRVVRRARSVGVVVLVGLVAGRPSGSSRPGGGFQGGVVSPAGAVVVCSCASATSRGAGSASEQSLDPFEGVGAAAYVVARDRGAGRRRRRSCTTCSGRGRRGRCSSGGSMSIAQLGRRDRGRRRQPGALLRVPRAATSSRSCASGVTFLAFGVAGLDLRRSGSTARSSAAT